MINLFFSYAHEDEALRDELEDHLAMLKASGLVRMYHDRRIQGGIALDAQISEYLNSADIILLLVSSHFLSSDYCFGVEMRRALRLHAAGKARVVPVILRPCDWLRSPLKDLRATPRDGRPVTEFQDPHVAFQQITDDVWLIAEELGRAETAAMGVSVAGAVETEPKEVGAAATPRVTISSINQRRGEGSARPANLRELFGQLDVVLDVDTGGSRIVSVSTALSVADDHLVQTQSASADAQGFFGRRSLQFAYNTAAFSANGIPALHNGELRIDATIVLEGGVRVSAEPVHGHLHNESGVYLITVFNNYRNTHGDVVPLSTYDARGHRWWHGSVVVKALPVLYDPGNSIVAFTVTLPGASTPTQTFTSAPCVAVWTASNDSDGRPNVVGRRLFSSDQFETDGVTPAGVRPVVTGTDNFGRIVNLTVLNPREGGAPFRVDNTL